MDLNSVAEHVNPVLAFFSAHTNTIINVVLIAVLVICAWQGYKKGIIMGIIEVLVIILSLYGAQLLSDTYSYEVIPVLKPFVSGYMENQVEVCGYTEFGFEPDDNGQFHVTRSLADMMLSDPGHEEAIARATYQSLGLYDELADTLTARTLTYAEENEASLASSVVTITCQTVTWYGGFLLAFIILFAILTVIVNIPNLSFKIPYVGIVNDIGGIAIGVFVGLLFCSILVWLCQFAGLLLTEQTLRGTGLAAFLMDKNLLANYITL